MRERREGEEAEEGGRGERGKRRREGGSLTLNYNFSSTNAHPWLLW